MNQETQNLIRQFVEERDWTQFHTPANLSKSIVLEAAELLELFQWDEENYDLERVKEELADILIYCTQMSQVLNLDMDEIIENKMQKNIEKYPVDKAKGSAKKYDEL